MAHRSEFLIFGRRLHNALRHAIEDGEGRTDDEWINVERPLFEHGACGIYLAGCMSFLEGRYGTRAWIQSPVNAMSFDDFIQSLDDPAKSNFTNAGINEAGIEALVCIRNAITHNNNDLSKNNDATCVAKVVAASIPGVLLSGTIVALQSNTSVDFMEYARKCFVAVSQYHGEG